MCRAPNESTVPIRLDLATRAAIKAGKPVAEFLPASGGVFEVSQTRVCEDAEPVQVPCASVAHHLLTDHPGHLFTLFGSKESRNDVINACDAPGAAPGVLGPNLPAKLHKALHIMMVNSSDSDVNVRFVVREHEPSTSHLRQRRMEKGASVLSICRRQDLEAIPTGGDHCAVTVAARTIHDELYLRPSFRIKTTFTLEMWAGDVLCNEWTFNLANSNTQRKSGVPVLPTQRVPRVFRVRVGAEADPTSRTVLSVFDKATSRFPSLKTVPTHELPVAEYSDRQGEPMPMVVESAVESAVEAASPVPPPAFAASPVPPPTFASLGSISSSPFSSLSSLSDMARCNSAAIQLGKRKREIDLAPTLGVDPETAVPPPKRVAANALSHSSDSSSSDCASPLGSVLSVESPCDMDVFESLDADLFRGVDEEFLDCYFPSWN